MKGPMSGVTTCRKHRRAASDVASYEWQGGWQPMREQSVLALSEPGTVMPHLTRRDHAEGSKYKQSRLIISVVIAGSLLREPRYN